MKSVIVGTAGHIDHGKTALVRALTGIDTDRLEEEKRRGITIELGFAHLELEGSQGPVRLGFVDVPGHERFVRTMLAGAGGIDFVLFVISAEDSVKPQTREHFDICRLLQVPQGITVLTKSDLVDQETLQVVRMEVEEFVRGSFLDTSRSPILEVSARTGEGMEQLKQELARVASEVAQKDTHAVFRLPVDRVFTMKGFGTVVTGTMTSGQLRKEQEVEVLPLGKKARVRGLQVHGTTTEVAMAGQRTALNLTGIPQEEIQRGMMLAQPGLLLPTRRLDVQLSLLDGVHPLKNRARVHLHLFTTETIAQIVLYEGEELQAGETVWAQLRTHAPVACAPGDRFIVRRFSPVTTIGGGLVVDVNPMRRMKPEARTEILGKLRDGDDLCRLRVLVARRERRGLSVEEAIHETGWTMERLNLAREKITQARDIISFGDVQITAPTLDRIVGELFIAVEIFQTANPLAGGISKQELLEKSGLDRELFAGALSMLLASKKLAITAEQVHLIGHRVLMKDEEAESKKQIEEAFALAGVKVPSLKEVLEGLKIDLPRAQKIVTLLLREKVLIKVSDELVFHRKTLENLKRRVSELKSTSPKIDVARFKDLAGVSRKYAIPLLEYLDREHVTRRVGDERIIL
ncbi:MAG: selenocysteine-specific translation elongation factor [Candidatus Korobacteraceae bacterium]|jgi:selenocysteine-specific elongation factor